MASYDSGNADRASKKRKRALSGSEHERPYKKVKLAHEKQSERRRSPSVPFWTDAAMDKHLCNRRTIFGPKYTRTFRRFQQLMPELRNLVYSFVFSDLLPPGAQALVPSQCPKQPAITRTGRQIQQESLSFFYATQTFVISNVGFPEQARSWGVAEVAQNRSRGPSCCQALTIPRQIRRDVIEIDKTWLRIIGEDNRANIQSVIIANYDDEIHYIVGMKEIRVSKLSWTRDSDQFLVENIGTFRRTEKAIGGLLKLEDPSVHDSSSTALRGQTPWWRRSQKEVADEEMCKLCKAQWPPICGERL